MVGGRWLWLLVLGCGGGSSSSDTDPTGPCDCSDEGCVASHCDEQCRDGIDNDADGLVDCADPFCDGRCEEVCDDLRDNDGDDRIDCADIDCLEGCDGDGDGWAGVEGGGMDCADDDPTIHPDAIEVCDGLDNDCDGRVDDDDPDLDPTGAPTWFEDLDGDGAGELQGASCETPPGSVSVGGDCDDADPAIFPGAEEVCGDGIDADCDGVDPSCNRLLGDVSASEAMALYSGSAADGVGAILGSGDVNGDGRADVLLGSPGAQSAAGEAVLLWGPVTGTLEVGDADGRFLGDLAGMEMGASLASGDMTGDGADDIWVGAPGRGGELGAAYLFLGPGGGTITADLAYAAVVGADIGARTGEAIATGHADADGGLDVFIGAPGCDVAAVDGGCIYLISAVTPGPMPLPSSASSVLQGTVSGEQIGTRLGTADLDGDGLDDLLSTGTRPALDVALGPWTPGPSAFTPGLELTAPSDVEDFTTGDFDGDGHPDLAIAVAPDGLDSDVRVATELPVSGVVDLATAHALVGTTSVSVRPTLLSSGDIDDDGVDDLVVADVDLQGAAILYGPILGSGELASVAGANLLASGLGGGVEVIGDTNDDGYLDVLVGTNTGRVYLYGGAP